MLLKLLDLFFFESCLFLKFTFREEVAPTSIVSDICSIHWSFGLVFIILQFIIFLNIFNISHIQNKYLYLILNNDLKHPLGQGMMLNER
jgi:hypothetical protein